MRVQAQLIPPVGLTNTSQISLTMTGKSSHQWAPFQKNGLDDVQGDIMMLTTDIALRVTKLGEPSKHAWCKLTTRYMGPITSCIGDPPAQVFRTPLIARCASTLLRETDYQGWFNGAHVL
jgi:hypothetical protein